MTESTAGTSPKQTRLQQSIKLLVGKLYPFQREWLGDRSRFKVAVKARQIGLSLCLGLEGLLDALMGKPVYYVSRTEKQSVYLLEKFYKWAKVLEDLGNELPFDSRSRTECILNGVDVKSLTSNAVADEGYTGNVYLDEFALHEDDERIYRSLYPTITWGYNLRIVSRPFGQSNKFHDIFTNHSKYPDYRRYQFDIYRAVRDGLPINIDEIRRNFDEEGFRENYLCEFIDESTAYIPYNLIRLCVGDYPEKTDGGVNYLGVDIGRKHDHTIVYVLTQLGDKLYTKTYHRLTRESFENQRAFIVGLMQSENIHRGAIDSSGLGMQLGEELHKLFPLLEQVTFTNESKEKLAVLAKRHFEQRTVQIPEDSKLISSIHSIRKMVTSSNNIRFDAARNQDGHADEFWALALGMQAATVRSGLSILFEV